MADNVNGRADKSRMPYELIRVTTESYVFRLNGKEYTVAKTPEMEAYIVDAGIRTRVSAAGAGKGHEALGYMEDAARKLQAGTVGRVGFDSTTLEGDIAKMELEDIKDIQVRIGKAPKSKQTELLMALTNRLAELTA